LTDKIDMDEKMRVMVAQLPGVMNALAGLNSEVVRDGALSARTKELIMVGISVALRCENCIAKHVSEALRLGATREEILEAVGTAILMSGGPGAAYGGIAVKMLDELNI
jgi:AhpD family alkylhydroperoxidase